jgi:hypothetical protein
MQPRHLLISVPPERAMWWSRRRIGRVARPGTADAAGRGVRAGMGLDMGDLVPLRMQRAAILPGGA